MADREAVKVIVRCRPFSEKEAAAGHSNIVQIDKKQAVVAVLDPSAGAGSSPKTFTFDSVFDISSSQQEVYNISARPIVDAVLAGYNGTIFAYGQTGTGKTFSMQGIKEVPELRGIIPNAIEQIFSYIKSAGTSAQFLVRASYLEIYNEEIRDLLSPQKGTRLDVKERPDVGVYVKDLSTFVVKDIQEMDRLMDVGNKNRSVGYTDMNAQSSRSHSIFSITVEVSEKGEDGEEHLRAGKLHLVDLAGSERQSKTGATGDRLKEATKINLSLSALGNVISALVDGKSSHIPYRDSKLTRLLQDSLGGNAKTLMVATMSPASYNYDETISTLRYANRAKNIKNKPKVNEDPKDAMLREFQEEIKRLKKMLEDGGGELGEVIQEVEEIEEIEEVEEVEVEDDEPVNQKTSQPGNAAATVAKSAKSTKAKKASEPTPKNKEAKKPRKKSAVESTPQTNASGVSVAELDEMQKMVEREKQALLAAKDMEESERNRLLTENEARAKELEKERLARAEVSAKLAQLEQKLLVGGVNILDTHESQKLMLAKRAQELEERARRERELKRELEEHEEANLAIEEEFTNLQEEAAAKTKKIKKLWKMIGDQQEELKDLQEELQREREDLLETIRELTREIKLKAIIINGFIPQAEYHIIEDFSEYDETSEKWRVAHIAHAGNNIRGKRALVSGKILQNNSSKHLGRHQREQNKERYDDDEPFWDPMCVFPNLFLSYDVPGLKRRENRKTSLSNSATGKVKRDGSGNMMKTRPGSRNALKDKSGTGSEVVLEQQSNQADSRKGSEANLRRKEAETANSTPTARGLVSRSKHYA